MSEQAILEAEVQVKDDAGQFIVYNSESGKRVTTRKTPKKDVPIVTTEEMKKIRATILSRKEAQDTSGLIDWENLPVFVVVDPRMTDKDIVELNENDVELRFDFEHFRELTGYVLDELDRGNVQRYHVEQAIYRRHMKKLRDQEEFGGVSDRVEVIGRTAEGRLRVEGAPEGIHPYWAAPQEMHEWRRNGYTVLDKKRYPEIVAGDSVVGSNRYCKRSDGQEDLVLMGCPEEVYEDYIQGMSDRSTGKVKGVQRATQDALEQKAGIRGVQVEQEMDVEKVTIAKMPKGEDGE